MKYKTTLFIALATALLAVSPANAAPSVRPDNLQKIEDIPNTYNTLNWDRYTLKELQSSSRVSAPDAICDELSKELDQIAYAMCSQAMHEKSALKRASLLFEASVISDNDRLATFAVTHARQFIAEPVVQALVSDTINKTK